MNALKKLVADFRDDPLAWRKLCWELAAKSGKTISRFVVDAVLNGDKN